MLGIDTNVLVRLLTRDDEAQFERARRLIGAGVAGNDPVFISLLVLMETEWMLRSRYALKKAAILGAFSDLLSAADVNLEDEPSIEKALYVWKDSRAQFADCLIGARNRACGCRATASFDTEALKLPGFVPA
jgi:predicted nucleic-acid-binding protein